MDGHRKPGGGSCCGTGHWSVSAFIRLSFSKSCDPQKGFTLGGVPVVGIDSRIPSSLVGKPWFSLPLSTHTVCVGAHRVSPGVAADRRAPARDLRECTLMDLSPWLVPSPSPSVPPP